MSKLLKSKFFLGILAVFVGVAFAVTASAADGAITKTLKKGMNDIQVKYLQQTLNEKGFTVAASGAGSMGSETSYFGPATFAAVKSFQSAAGLVADGVFGPLSRAALGSSASTGGLPTGCTSTAGYSSTTGVKCDSGSTGTMVYPAGCTGPTGYSSTTGVKCDGTMVGPTTGPVSAALSYDNPASGTLVAGQATADLAHFAFSGSGTVTSVTLKRLGVSADSTPSNVYLFDGATRLTDAASVASNGTVTFNVPAGIFTVSGLKNISVKSDIAASTSGQTVGFQLVSFTTASGAMTANLSGNIFTIASATLASVSAGTVTPSGATLSPGAGVTVWQSTLNVSQRDVWVKRLALRNVGSAPAASFQNFKLYVNGVQVGTSLGLDVNGYVTFDLMSAPVLLQSGSRVVRVDADIVSGASRTVNFSLRNAADVDFVDSSFGVNISPTSAPWGPTTNNTISGTSGGTLTIEKDVSSPSTNVTLAGNDINLATFKATAFGEPIKIETLTGGFTFTDGGTANAAATLRNGRMLVSTDGTNYVQYGSTATLLAAGTSFTLNYIITPGSPVWIQLHADIYDNDGTGALDTSDTLLGKLIAGSSNAQRVDSLGSFSTSLVSANTLSIASASATLVKNPTYADQNTVLPATNFKLGSWNLTGSSVEDILLTTLSFDVDAVSDVEFTALDMNNMYVVVKSGSTVVAQPAPLATVAAADNNFSINYTLLKNTNVTIDLFANFVDDSLTSTIDTGDSVKSDLTVTGTALVSGTAVNASSGDIDGQTIASAAASITVSKDSSSPVAGIVYDNQTIVALAAKFAAVTSGYNITDAVITLADATNVSSVVLYDGATLVSSLPGAATVTFSGLSWNVPANTNKVLTVKLVLGTVGVGAGTTGASLVTTITGFTAVNTSTGVSAAGSGSAASSALNVYAAIPTISVVTLADVTLLNTSARPLLRFTMTGNGGDVAWDFLTFKVVKDAGTTVGTDATTGISLWDVTSGGNTSVGGTFTNGSDVFGAATCAAGGATCDIKFIPTAENTVSGSKTYELRGNIAAANASGDFVTVTLDNDSTAVVASDQVTDIDAVTDAPIIWSDMSAASHSTATDDWTSDFGVKNLPVSASLNWPN